jgi:large subunit ribosomal protein L13
MKKIDAQGKSLGRVATEAAMALMGKDKAGYRPEKNTGVAVSIINASRVKITGLKLNQKFYKSYSGYPGGLKETKMKEVIVKKGYSEILKKAISGMMPKNRLHKLRMLSLTITE